MTIIACLSLIFAMVVSTPLIPNPLTLGIWVLLIAILITIFLAIPLTSWFSIIIFLIYIGGLLVIFAYFSAIDPNKKLGLTIPLLVAIILALVVLTILRNYTVTQLIHLINPKFKLMLALFSKTNAPILVFLAIVLLLALLVVVKVIKRNEGPIRPFYDTCQTQKLQKKGVGQLGAGHKGRGS